MEEEDKEGEDHVVVLPDTFHYTQIYLLDFDAVITVMITVHKAIVL